MTPLFRPEHAQRVSRRAGISWYQAAILITLERDGRMSTKSLCDKARPEFSRLRPAWGRGPIPGVTVYMHPLLATMATLELVSRHQIGPGWRDIMWQCTSKGRVIVKGGEQ